MPRKSSRPAKASRVKRADCESVQFAEVEFTAPVVPRLVIRFRDGLSLLVEDERAVPIVPMAAAFLSEFVRTRFMSSSLSQKAPRGLTPSARLGYKRPVCQRTPVDLPPL